MMNGVPRWLVIFALVLVAGVEIVSRLPDLLLVKQRLAGQAGEYGAKVVQPELATSQIAKTQADAEYARTQAELARVQAEKTQAETELTRVRAQVAAAEVAKTEADTRVANAQSTKTNLENMQTVAGAALTAGAVAYGVKLLQDHGMLGGSHAPDETTASAPQTGNSTQTTRVTQTSPDTPFEAGRADWHHWFDWEKGLTGDALSGAQYWAGVRSQKPQPNCAEAPGQITSNFVNACQMARKFLTTVDEGRRDPEYKRGWNAGARETGNL